MGRFMSLKPVLSCSLNKLIQIPKTMKKNLLILFLCCCFTTRANAQTGSVYTPVAAGVEYQYIGSYDVTRMNKIISQELENFLAGTTNSYNDFKGKLDTPKYPVKLYRVHYHSVIPEFDNRPAIASGLIAIPDNGRDSMPVISYQHGTVFGKFQCPSNPDSSMETRLMIARFAAQGYIVIGADYFGLGTSDLPNAYLIRNSSEQACLDMLFASRDVLSALKIKPGQLFLHGWSQGGWTTMTFLRKLESLNIPVAAAATASAPAEVCWTMDRWMNNYQPIDAVYLPACLSNFVFAVEYYCQIPGLAYSAIRPQFYQTAKDFYDWKTDWTTFRKATGDTVRNFFRPEFLATGNMAASSFWQIMETSQAYRWRCHTALNMYYGERDEVVPVYIAKLPEGFHKLASRGSTRAVCAGSNADHRGTFVYSIINVKPWFDGFLQK